LIDICREGKNPNFAMKAVIGCTAGGIGAFVGTPAEISLIRMTADGRYDKQLISISWVQVFRLPEVQVFHDK